ncbi:hypothetical protein FHW74_003469 [Atlantibacter sp. RC6]|nr:hypothetical protein [Atlantibacter sp. RC6]
MHGGFCYTRIVIIYKNWRLIFVREVRVDYRKLSVSHRNNSIFQIIRLH